MRLIMRSDQPRKYQFGWNASKGSIILKIHKDCLNHIQIIPPNSDIVLYYSKMHDIDDMSDSFCGDLSQDTFGFNRVLRKIDETGKYLTFEIPIPRIKYSTNLACERCSGTGIEPNGLMLTENNKCRYCYGTGTSYKHDWRKAYAITSSLSLLLNFLDINFETTSEELQEITLTMLAEKGPHGSSIGGCFSSGITRKILGTHPAKLEKVSTNIAKNMFSAHKHMFYSPHVNTFNFRTRINHSEINLEVPGDACGICAHIKKEDEGVEFRCHNVDSPLQSLTLLTGIAHFLTLLNLYKNTGANTKVT